MGLQFDRWVTQFTTETIPNWEKKIEEICGFKIKLQGDWKSFGGDADALAYFEDGYLDKFASALRDVCRDDVGKQAVKKQIKKMVAVFAPAGKKKEITLKDGVLTMKTCITSDRFFDTDVMTFLEKNL